MKKVLFVVMCLMVLGVTAQNAAQPDEFAYDHAIRWAIRGKAANPQSVSFSWNPPTYERIAPPVYERKYEIKIAGQTRYGYAKVQYKGGDPKDLNNWKVLKATIDK